MGLFSSIGSWVGGAVSAVSDFLGGGSSSGSGSSRSSSSNSNSNSLYEPDKVKIAEIEQETQLQLAGRESERIELMKEAKLEIMREEAKFQQALYAAQVQGLDQMAETISLMQERFNEVAQNRLKIIESGSMEIVKDIERFYHELQTSIEQKDVEFTETKLPKLLEQLEKYDENSAAFKLYFKKIDNLIANQSVYAEKALAGLLERQKQIVESSLATKEKIIEHTDKLTAQLVERMAETSGLLQQQANNSERQAQLETITPQKQLEH